MRTRWRAAAVSVVDPSLRDANSRRILFTAAEIRAASGRPNPAETLAARLAAKRALAAILFDWGWQWPLPYASVEVGSTEKGRPHFTFRDRNLARFLSLNARGTFVSLSHTRTLGCAAVAVEMP